DDVKARRGGRELLDDALREGANDDGIDPAFEVAGDVGDRLALPEGDIGLERDDVAAELADRDFEGGPRPQRGLLEQKRDVASVQRVGGRRLPAQGSIAFELRCELQAP